MKTHTLRTVTAVVLIAVVTVGFVTNFGIGTVSAIGWSDISLLCPLGALGTMLASKMLVPKAVISLIFALFFIIILGRAFCAWLCPVPIVQKVRGIFAKKPQKTKGADSKDAITAAENDVNGKGAAGATFGPASSETVPANLSMAVAYADTAATAEGTSKNAAPLSDAETAALKGCGSEGGCATCAEKRGKALDARHFVLGGSLLSAAVFGFPVFCLICPIGLSFATILLVIRLFGGGDVTWSLIVVPLVLIAEVVLFRKWCSKLCPLSAFMSLVGKANRSFRPAIDDGTCIETARGRKCGICADVCPEGIDPRHPENGSAWSECTKCRACVEACPTKSITMPLLPRKKPKASPTAAPDTLEPVTAKASSAEDA